MNTSHFLVVGLLVSNLVAMEIDNGAGLRPQLPNIVVNALEDAEKPLVGSYVAAKPSTQAVNSPLSASADCCSSHAENVIIKEAKHVWSTTKSLFEQAKVQAVAQKNNAFDYAQSVKTRGWTKLDKNEKLVFAAVGTVLVASAIYAGYKLYKSYATRKQSKHSTVVTVRNN